MASGFVPVPDWFAWENQDCGMAIGDINRDGSPDVVVLMVDNPKGQNTGFYRVGSGFGTDGTAKTWGPWLAVPQWFGWENQGTGIALADLSGNGQLDLVVFVVDNPPGQNQGYYRIGRDLAADGTVTAGWTPWLAVPDWYGWENQGADICVTRIDGQAVLVVLTVDNPKGQNSGQFRLAKGLTADGTVAEWTPWVAVPDWYGWENQGAGITAADLNGDGKPELVVFTVDNPGGANSGVYTVGWGLDGSGHALDGWSAWTKLPWGFLENQGAAVALLPGAGTNPELVICTIDAPQGRNIGYLQVLELETDLRHAAHQGLWRILDFGTEINPVHAALLHTGDVLFFAGSGNDEVKHVAHEFRTRVWHYPNSVLSAPDTPIDLFCAGQAFLPDGRLLVAGGTARYDPFYGLRDTLVFDPMNLSWNRLPDMAFGRWYPSLVTLADGKVVSVSGLGTDNHLSVVPELFDDTTRTWSTLPVPGPIPMYGHLVLLADGRLFYTGGQYGANNGMRPSIWNPTTGATTVVGGLSDPGSRNQAASVLLPPAQQQRVLILGGGGFDLHSPAPALADARVVDTTAANPQYQPVQPMDHARMHLSAVLLPDRTVLATGGSGMEEMAHAAPAHAEIFDPGAGTWMHTAPSRIPRLYHSVALLTPEGKVITAGSNPVRRTEEYRIEIYSPPYLFRGPRPALTLSTTSAHYGATVTAGTDTAIREASLMRPGACTHSCDNEQRLVDVQFTATAPDSLTLTMPTNPALAPPGWYLLFVVNTSGVPSTGQWLRLN